MVSILASKLFMSSNKERQDRILCSIGNTNNAELVQQITEYLDDEFIDAKYLCPDKLKELSDHKETIETQDVEDDTVEDSDGFVPISKFGSFSSENSNSNNDSESTDFSSDADNTEDKSSDTDTDTDKSSEEIHSSTDISISLDGIKNILNLRDDTKGVSRVKQNDSEIWVYYEDSINLNKVLFTIVDVISASGYSNLEFNRCARSNNAVVFDIVSQTIDTVQGVKDE